jgi:hypothetical protein
LQDCPQATGEGKAKAGIPSDSELFNTASAAVYRKNGNFDFRNSPRRSMCSAQVSGCKAFLARIIFPV